MLNCAQFEILLADHLDGTLHAADRDAFLHHQGTCPACALLLEDAQSALAFMDRAAETELPPALVGKILHATNGGWELRLRAGGIRGWINRTFAPVLQPRIVMGGLLTVMSLTLVTHTGVTHSDGNSQKNAITVADFAPSHLWTALDDRTHRIYDRAVKNYESIRLVYEVRNQLDEWQQQEEEEAVLQGPASQDSK